MNNKNGLIPDSDLETLESKAQGLEAEIKEWKAKHKDIYEIGIEDEDDKESVLDGVRIICRAPGRAELSRFIKDVTAGDALKAQNNFFFGCLLHPKAEVLKEIVDEKPGIIVALGNKLQEITGISQNFTMTKL